MVRPPVVLVVLPVLVAAAARADQPPAQQGPLETITVTAERHKEPLDVVPMTITALDQDAMDKSGIKSIADIAREVPGLNFRSNDFMGDTQISIRGIYTDAGAATTGIYIDDTPVQARPTDMTATNPYPKVFDLDRVEVLKGPQGTLFGAGSEGGTVRFLTPDASLTDYSGFIKGEAAFTAGGDPSWEVGAAVGGPIVDGKLGFRASAWQRLDGGYIDRVASPDGASVAPNAPVVQPNANWNRSDVAHLVLKLAATDHLTITASVYYQDVFEADRDFYWESLGPFYSSYRIPQPRDDKFTLPTLTLEYDFDDFSVKSITSFLARSVKTHSDATAFDLSALTPDGSITLPGDPSYLARGYFHNSQENFTEELRLTSADNGSPLFWVGGLYYQHNRQGIFDSYAEPINTATEILYGMSAYDYFGEGPIGPGNAYSEIQNEIFHENDMAVFGNVSYSVTDQLKAQAGLRVARSGFDFFDIDDGPYNSGLTIASGSEKETPVTPRFSLSYQLEPQTMLYATAAKGYRTGGANESLAGNVLCAGDLQSLGLKDVPPTYNSDSVWSYEAGTKSRLFGNRLELDASLFWIDWSQIQGLVYLPTCGYYYTTNLGQAASRGVELQAAWAATDHLVISGTAGFTDARYTKSSFNSNGTVLLAKAGDPLATPEWSTTLAADWDTELGDDWSGYVHVEYDFAGSYYRTGDAETFGYDPATRWAPATHYVTLRDGVKRGPWDVSLFINNALNSTTSLYRYHDIVGSPWYRDETYRPITVGLTAEYKF